MSLGWWSRSAKVCSLSTRGRWRKMKVSWDSTNLPQRPTLPETEIKVGAATGVNERREEDDDEATGAAGRVKTKCRNMRSRTAVTSAREGVKVAEDEQRCGERCKKGKEAREWDKITVRLRVRQQKAGEGGGSRHTSHRGGEELRGSGDS